MDVGQVRYHRAAVFTYQFLHEVGPSMFLDFYGQNNDLQPYYTRNATNLVTENRRNRRTGIAIKHLVQSAWNSLPDSVKVVERPQLFIRKR